MRSRGENVEDRQWRRGEEERKEGLMEEKMRGKEMVIDSLALRWKKEGEDAS